MAELLKIHDAPPNTCTKCGTSYEHDDFVYATSRSAAVAGQAFCRSCVEAAIATMPLDDEPEEPVVEEEEAAPKRRTRKKTS